MATQAPSFRKGGEAAKEGSKGGANFQRTNFFQIEDGESTIIRMITDVDDWITVDQHQYAPTKTKPKDKENWPSHMSVVCQDDEAFGDMFPDCYCCNNVKDARKKDKKTNEPLPHRPGSRTWALAVIREEVKEGGQVIGIKDAEEEVAVLDEDGKPTDATRMAKKIVLVNMGYKNFFSKLQGAAGLYGTVLDRDFYVKREGDGTDTDYHVVGMDPIFTGEVDDNNQPIKFDLRNPEIMARYEADMPDLGGEIVFRATTEYHRFWFDPDYTGNPDGSEPEPSDDDDDSAKPDNDASDEKMTALADRVKGYTAM